ncbi:MAG: F0F1 ATP synthase subunit epsilon [Planctomycetes bacterium]|nr:F0F1 ATP synthase subunit epsilon [Planctomycetota bacterium]
MADTFQCTLVTPEEAVFDEEVTYVTFPAWDGQQGVMRGQSPLLTKLGIGPMRLDLADGASRWYLVERGFAQVVDDALTLITERATRDTDLVTDGIDEALADANRRVVGGDDSGGDRRQAEIDQQRAMAVKAMAARAAGSR